LCNKRAFQGKKKARYFWVAGLSFETFAHSCKGLKKAIKKTKISIKIFLSAINNTIFLNKKDK